MRKHSKNQAIDAMLLPTMISLKPITFITGKGGVGKSMIAASLALAESQKDKKVLLVELGEKSFFEKFFHLRSDGPKGAIGYEPKEVFPNLSICTWSYRECLREYVSFFIKSKKIYDVFFDNSVMQKFIQAAPALKELAILGKATSGPRQVGPPMGFDYIVIDSYSSGHHKALLNAPAAMAQTIRHGPMAYHSEKILEVIRNASLSTHFVVLKPEELPTVEGLELCQFLKKEQSIDAQIVLNQYMNFPLEEKKLNELSISASAENMRSLCKEFFQFSKEQNECFSQIKQAQSNFFVTPFVFDKQNSQTFLTKIFAETKST